MTQHIGIVGVSAEGAALCYRTICTEGEQYLATYGHPEVSMHTFPLNDYMKPIIADEWSKVGEVMLTSMEKLVKMGVDFIICPDNTVHQAIPYIESRLPLPFLHIADVVAEYAVEQGFNRLGLTGTQWLVESDVYAEKLTQRELDYVRPTLPERQEISRIIMDELIYGDINPTSITYFQQVMNRMKDDGCDAVILGCTEIPLIMNDGNSPLPTLDSTRLLARVALRQAVQPTESSLKS
jgi:aspartate racemase